MAKKSTHKGAPKSKKQLGIELQESWDDLLTKHSKPLEYGLIARSNKPSVTKLISINLTPYSGRERLGDRIPSKVTSGGNTNKYPIKHYTGSLIKGIAVMHKSNAIPVLNQEDVIAVSHMRR